MKIMTFNTQHCLNFLEQKIDFQLMAKTILDYGADIIGLNEMRGEGEREDYTDQVPKLSQLTSIPYFYFAKAIDVDGKNPYGNGILSKFKITEVKTIPIPDPIEKAGTESYETRCILKATLENGLTVLVTHFGLNPEEQENAVKTVIENLPSQKCVLMGDFNVTPDNPVLAPIRERMTDTANLFNEDLLSYPSDKPNVKIDYIFVSPDIEVISADIPSIVTSDHRPHRADIAYPNQILG